MSIYPLEDLRVLDFGWVLAGPVVATLLGNLGAEVIKIESRKRIDSMRLSPDNLSLDPEKDLLFHSLNRNKLSISIDITHPKANKILKGLVEISDVVVENFSARVMARHGLDYQALKGVNPSIIMISLPATGMSGPLSDVITYGNTLQALGGAESLVGYYGEQVLGMQQAWADYNAAIHGFFAVLAALYYRKKTGKGQHIEAAQLDPLISSLGEAIMEYTMNGRVLGPQGNRNPTMAPHNNYRCQGEDKWVSIAIKTEEEWQSFCQAMGNPPWTKEERFADRYKRMQNQEELDKFISQWTINYSHYEVMEILQKAGVAAVPCLDVEERFFDPHFNEREAYITIEHPVTGTDFVANLPWKMSRTPGGIRRSAPMLGGHNDYVFGKLLNMSQEEIAELVEEKVLY